MAVFISYSHEDADFVDQLAFHLVADNARVWVDRWELHVGDSLRQRIEAAIEQASAVLFVLSPASVASDWCQRELSAGLVRELEERRVVVLPVLVADCQVPLFLRDKMYADFRSDFDRGLRQVREALAKVTSQGLGRMDEVDGHIDWATRWGLNEDGEAEMRITIVQQSEANPYTVLSHVTVTLNGIATKRHLDLVAAGAEGPARQLILETISEIPELEDFRVLLTDAEPVGRQTGAVDSKVGLDFSITATCQRLGEDTGRDVLVPVGAVLKGLAAQTRDRLQPLTKEQRALAIEILRKYRPDIKR